MKSKTLWILALLCVWACCKAIAENPKQVCSTRMDELFSRWNSKCSPGCAVGVFHEGEIIFQRGYGSANLDHGVPITPNTVFYIGSVSKQFTAAAIAILADRGKLSLKDDVRKYIPELPEFERQIRIKDLVFHTSGLRDLYALMSLAEINVANVLSIDDKLNLIARQTDLNFLPGDEFSYNNSGYTLMAILVERVSGQSLRKFMHDNVFVPLGMENTHFHDNRHEIVRGRALSYSPGRDGEIRLTYLSNFEGVGPGGLYTTIGDLFLWEENFFYNRIPDTRNFLGLMHTKGVLNNGDTLHYAFGLNFGNYKGLKTVGHGGSFMGFRAHYLRIPEHRFAVAVLCNMGDINPANLSNQIVDLYLADVIEKSLTEYAGTYKNIEFETDFEIVVSGGELYVKDHSSFDGQLLFTEADVFRREGWQFRFVRNGQNYVEGVMLSNPRARNIFFKKQ